MGKYADSNPVAGSKEASGTKNDDGRELGSAYNNSNEATMKAEHTFDPNENAPSIAKGDRPGAE